MRGLLLFAVVLCPLAGVGARQPQPAPRQRVEVLKLEAGRESGRILIDGAVKNTGQRRLPALTLVFDLLDSDGNVMSRLRGPIEDEVLEPAAESEFHFYVSDHVRAVLVRVSAVSGRGMDVEVVNGGPFPLD